MDYSTLGFPALHHLWGFAQTQIHWVSDAIQPSHPLLSLSPPALNKQAFFSFILLMIANEEQIFYLEPSNLD